MSDIRDWLEGLGLGQFAEAFEREEINPASVPHLTDGMLKELGLPMGPRAQILGAAKTLGAGSDFPEVRRAPPADYTPAPLAEKILSTRSSIEGERKQVTVLFADIKGSTEIIQALDPEDARALLDPMLNIMIDAVHTYEGTVNDVQGDGIMAIFGAPIAHEDHAFRACRAALDMQDARVENRPSGSPLPAVQLRVGLNSGEVVVRAINNDLTMSYSAVGVTTHLAARMEQTAEPGTIRISRSTNRLVEGLVSAASLGDITVKGLPKPIEVFELTGLGQAQTQLEAASLESLTRFVGRSVELGYLTERLSETESGRGQVVLVVGDPGIGKSRLLMEFRRQIGSRADWHEGRCISFGQSMAFHPLIGLLRRTFGIEERNLSETARDKISVWTERIATDIVPNLPLLHYLLGVAEPDDPVQAMDPSLRRAETFEALNQLLSLESERMPQILVFEDVHWSDAATKEFIAYLLDSVPRSQILIILTTRPDYTAPVEERSFVSRLALNHLSETESKEMGVSRTRFPWTQNWLNRSVQGGPEHDR